MVGKFKAKKFKGTWCFIAGDDGKDYFFHISNLKDPRDFEYVIDGNECAFDAVLCDGKPASLAHNVIPNPVKRKENVRKSPIIVNKIPSGERYWVITFRTYGTSDPFIMLDPPTVYKQRSDAEEKFYFLQTEHVENTYHLRQCVVSRNATNKYVVTSLPYKSDQGGVVYAGNRLTYI